MGLVVDDCFAVGRKMCLVASVVRVEMDGLLAAALTFFRCFLRLVPSHETSESMNLRLI